VKVDTVEATDGDSNGALLASEIDLIRTAPSRPLIVPFDGCADRGRLSWLVSRYSRLN
jgi:hypothetical protein